MLIADLHERLRLHVLATIKSRQFTQYALGQMAGIGQAHISNYLLGKRGLSRDAMDTMLKVLGLDVTSLIVMSGKTPSPEDILPSLESVQLVEHKAAMNPAFGKNEILGELGFAQALLLRPKAYTPKNRTAWVRFIAIRADTALAAPMQPRLLNGSVLLVDRHYCSLAGNQKDGGNLYLIRKEQLLMVRRAEMQGSNLCLRPDSSEHPLDFICIDRKHPLTSCIVGQVAHIATALDSPGAPL